MKRVLVIGAGAAGLAATARLQQRGVSVALWDRHGVPGGAYARMDPAIELASPTVYTQLDETVSVVANEYVSAREYADYLQRFATHHRIEVQRAEVRSLRSQQHEWIAESDRGVESFACVVSAAGMFDNPFWPAITGIQEAVANGYVLHAGAVKALPKDGEVLVVGAGTSAVELAEACVRASLQVTVSTRKGRVWTAPKRFWGRDLHDYGVWLEKLPRSLFFDFCRKRPTIFATDLGFNRYLAEGRIKVVGPVAAFEERIVRFANGDRRTFSAVFCATGYRYELGVIPSSVERFGVEELPRTSRNGESRSHPGLFFLGTPCALSGNSEFLRGIRNDAPSLADGVLARLKSHTS